MALCHSGDGANGPSSSRGSSSGAHYALCALGVGLVALGIIMIVWTVIPTDGSKPPAPSGNSTTDVQDDGEEDPEDHKSSSAVAMVLVGVGAAMLLLSLCLGVRSKRRASSRRSRPAATAGADAALLNHVPGQQSPGAADPTSYGVPSYDEVVGSSDYPVRQSNLRSSTSQLPSYEDILAAVANEGAEPAASEATPLSDPAPEVAPSPDPPKDSPGLNSQNSLPSRSTSRASRFLRPLRVRRIKSDKLHLKDFRLQIRSPTQNPVTIEPITPPPQYDTKMPELV